jgi:hypothetical protein
MSSVEEAIARVGETAARVETKVNQVDDRVRLVEVDIASMKATLSAPKIQWTAVVSAVIPSIISGAALLVVILQFSQKG